MTESPAHRTTLPPCPSWCTEEHHQAANPVELADFSNLDGLGAPAKEASRLQRVCHRRQIGHGTTAVLIYQVVDVGADGSVLHHDRRQSDFIGLRRCSCALTGNRAGVPARAR